MTSSRGPEVGRLTMHRENSVPGRGPAGAKALRWEGSTCVWGATEGRVGRVRERVVGEIRGTDGDLWWKVSFLFWKTFESFWIGTWLNLNFLGKITLASGELICPDWTGRQGYHEEAPADSRRETGTMEAWTTGECVLSLSVKQPPSEVSQT